MPRLANKKQRAFVNAMAAETVKTGRAPVAAKVYQQIYDCSPVASYSAASRLVRNPLVKEAYLAAISKFNPPDAVAKDLRRLRRTTRGVYYEGKLVAEEADTTAQTTAIALTLRHTIGADTPTVDARTVNFNANLDIALLSRVADTLTQLNESLSLTPQTHIVDSEQSI